MKLNIQDKLMQNFDTFEFVNSENQELDLVGGQILGNNGSFELAQALRDGDENRIAFELLHVDDLELRERLTTIVLLLSTIQGNRR